jgi:regulator of cell morphogenesis and NO signaling
MIQHLNIISEYAHNNHKKMNYNHKFNKHSRMSEVINDEPSLLSSISRFGISLGFGNKTIKEACELNEIHCETFLAVINFIAEGNIMTSDSTENISIEAVINYLKNAHQYFLNYKLPSIRTKLIDAIDASGESTAYSMAFMKFFDEYFDEVRKHMDYEDKTVFPYVLQLLHGKANPKFKIADFEEHHTEIDSKLSELKNILIKYYPSQKQNYALNDVLYDLLWCEKDLALHNQVEDYFFVPVIEAIENKLAQQA